MGRVSSESKAKLNSKTDAKKVYRKRRENLYKPGRTRSTNWPAALKRVVYLRFRSSRLPDKILEDLRVILEAPSDAPAAAYREALQMYIDRWLASDEFDAEMNDYVMVQDGYDKNFKFRSSKYKAGESTCEFIISSLLGTDLESGRREFEVVGNFILTSKSHRWHDEATYKMQVDYVFRNLFPVGNTKRAPDTCMISLLGFKDETSLCGPELFAILALARGLMDKVHPEGEEKPESYTVRVFSIRCSLVRRLKAKVTMNYVKWLIKSQGDHSEPLMPLNIEQTPYYDARETEGMRSILNILME